MHYFKKLFSVVFLFSVNSPMLLAVTSNIENINVVGKRLPLYEVRDVNAAALGIKDSLSLPISISSFSQELILNQRLRTLSEVLSNDASVQNTAIGVVFDFVSLRGFQLDWNNGLRRDGLALAPYQDVALENIQRVDVLKGPSGLLFGFNNPGGTINYVTKRPTLDNFVEISTETRSRDGKYLHIDSGGKFFDATSVGYRFNAAIEDTGDFTGGDDLERYFASVAIDWQPVDKLLLRLDMDYQDKSVVSQPLIGLVTDPNDANKKILPPYVDLSDVLLGQPWARYETETINVGVRVDYSINDQWQFVAQTAYSENDRFTIFPDIYEVNLQGDVLSSEILVTPDETYDSLSHHSFISGQFNSGTVKHELVAGVSYRELESVDGRWFYLDNPVGNIFNPVYTAKPVFPTIPEATQSLTKETAYFITDVIHLTESFNTTLGLRRLNYTKDRQPPNSINTRVEDEHFNTPTVGINYNPSDYLSTYISYSEGAGEGGVAVIGSGAINEGETLEPQESEQIEVGIKYRSQLATYTLAVYEIVKMLEYHNRISNYFEQDGEQVHRGIELNVNGQLSKNLMVVASTSYIDAQLKKLNTQTIINGNQPANVPELQANLFLDYQLPFIPGLNTNLGIFYVGERAQNIQNTLYLPSYSRVDAGFRYQLTELGSTLRLKIENVFDKQYWASAGAKGIDWGVMPGRGRTVVASLTVDF